MTNGNGSSASSMSRDRFDHLTATQLHVERSAVRSVDADQARLEKAAVQRLRASQATFERSAVGIASFDQGTIRQSAAGAIVARSVACDEVRTGVLVSPVVRGEVHTWLDIRSAVAVGVGIVLGRTLIGLTRSLGRRLLG